MVRGRVDPDDVMEQSFNDPEIKRLAASMSVVESDTYNAAFPANRISSVTLTLKNGEMLTSGDTEALGEPENPVTEAEVKAKFHAYARPKLGDTRTDALEKAVGALGDGSGLDALQDLIFAPLQG
jgi:2-methylcitrate dehydratase PrpD